MVGDHGIRGPYTEGQNWIQQRNTDGSDDGARQRLRTRLDRDDTGLQARRRSSSSVVVAFSTVTVQLRLYFPSESGATTFISFSNCPSCSKSITPKLIILSKQSTKSKRSVVTNALDATAVAVDTDETESVGIPPSRTSPNAGKVRQLFAERRRKKVSGSGGNESNEKRTALRSTVIGRDKSYPLRPLQRHERNEFEERRPAVDQFDDYDYHEEAHTEGKPIAGQQRHQNDNDRWHTNLVKVSSWPTIIDTFDTAIFGKLPNLGGEPLSDGGTASSKKKVDLKGSSKTFIDIPNNMSTSRIPARVPTSKISPPSPLYKITRGMSRLSTASNTSPSSSVNHEKQQTTNQRPVRQTNHLSRQQKNGTTVENKNALPQVAISTGTRKAVGLPKKKTPVNEGNGGNNRSPKSLAAGKKTQPPPPGMIGCKICGRHFAKERVGVHEEICEKASRKKRKVFDPVKHRLRGTEAEAIFGKSIAASSSSNSNTLQPTKKAGNWRRQHEEFLANIRAARQLKQHLAKGGKVSDIPPPPPLDTSDYIQCSHCGRRFNEAAANRHIPKCATMRHNKPKNRLPQTSTTTAVAPTTKLAASKTNNVTRKR